MTNTLRIRIHFCKNPPSAAFPHPDNIPFTVTAVNHWNIVFYQKLIQLNNNTRRKKKEVINCLELCHDEIICTLEVRWISGQCREQGDFLQNSHCNPLLVRYHPCSGGHFSCQKHAYLSMYSVSHSGRKHSCSMSTRISRSPQVHSLGFSTEFTLQPIACPVSSMFWRPFFMSKTCISIDVFGFAFWTKTLVLHVNPNLTVAPSSLPYYVWG